VRSWVVVEVVVVGVGAVTGGGGVGEGRESRGRRWPSHDMMQVVL
jgi:hypothetical protein